ncbi:MAG: hypothetical protein HY893_03685 [Deltaproteobacteria bacterium]|nr:hypothetical protein [Deltaproteobacteria bacterium]
MAIDWEGVKVEFESGSSIKRISGKYGCSASTVLRRAKKEKWKRGTEAKKARGPLDDGPACVPGEVLDDHRSLWRGVKKRLVKGLRSDDAKLGLEELKVAKIAGEVLSSVIKGERQAWGLEAGTDDPEEIAKEMARATVPEGADEADDGK